MIWWDAVEGMLRQAGGAEVAVRRPDHPRGCSTDPLLAQSSDHRPLPALPFSRAFMSHEYLREVLLKLLGCRLETRSCRYSCLKGEQGLGERG